MISGSLKSFPQIYYYLTISCQDQKDYIWNSHKHTAVSCRNIWPINISYTKFAEPVVLVFIVSNAFSHKKLAEKRPLWLVFSVVNQFAHKELAEKAFVVSFQCGQSLYSQEACKKKKAFVASLQCSKSICSQAACQKKHAWLVFSVATQLTNKKLAKKKKKAFTASFHCGHSISMSGFVKTAGGG